MRVESSLSKLTGALFSQFRVLLPLRARRGSSRHNVSIPTCLQLGEAMKDLEEAINMDPRQPLFYLNRALIKEKWNDLSGAKEDYSKALQRSPNSDWCAACLRLYFADPLTHPPAHPPEKHEVKRGVVFSSYAGCAFSSPPPFFPSGPQLSPFSSHAVFCRRSTDQTPGQMNSQSAIHTPGRRGRVGQRPEKSL